MLRTIVNGVLVLAVVGAGYWYWSSESSPATADLINTPRPSTLKGPAHTRVAKAKATLKTASAPTAFEKSGAKLAAAEEKPEKDSSNKPFSGLKASSLVKPKPKPKPNATRVASAPAETSAKPNKASAAKALQQPGLPKKALATNTTPEPAAKVQKLDNSVNAPPASKAPVKMDAVPSTPIEGFSLRRIALANEVENREPVGVATNFGKGTRVHLFMDAKNLSDKDLELVVSWHDPAQAQAVTIPLKVPAHAGRYRTWANSSPIYRPGTHEVSVQVKDGPEVYRTSFTVAASQNSGDKSSDAVAR